MNDPPARHIADVSPFSVIDGEGRLAGNFSTRGGESRADRVEFGEAAWTLLHDNMWEGHPNRITRFTTTPYPRRP